MTCSSPTCRPGRGADPEAAQVGRRAGVELDAVAPDQLTALIDDAVPALVDIRARKVVEQVEAEEREGLLNLAGGRS